MAVQIEVTEQDIRFGQPRHFFKCPLALAVQRQFGKGASVNVASIHLRNAKNDIPLPSWVAYKRDCYDKSGKLKPFSFVVNIAAPSEERQER